MISIDKYINRFAIEQTLTLKISTILNNSGIFYRCWARVKSEASTDKKLSKHTDDQNYKMQDLIGFRIACYFVEDIELCESILGNVFVEKVESASIDKPDSETFKPVRRNRVYELPEDIMPLCDEHLWSNKIDKTFEVQFRTIFSEGWHEVEHDLRYKNKAGWEKFPDFSRKLNGLYAALETSEWALVTVCDDLAYQQYKNKDWENMLRNKIRLRLSSYELPDNIKTIFNNSNEIAKKFLNYDKAKLVMFLSKSRIPINLVNIIYCINLLDIKEENILKATPELIKKLVANE